MKWDGNWEFVGAVSSGLCAVTAQVKRSKTGASMSLQPFRRGPCSKAELSSARYCLGNGWGTHPAVLGIEAVSTEFVLLPSPVWESICTEKVCQSQKRSHRSFFPFCTSDLHISDCHVQSKRVHGVLLPIADKNWQYL